MKRFIAILLLSAGASIQAQTVELTEVTGAAGGTAVVEINYTAGANLASFSVQITYDSTRLTPQTDMAANPNVNGCTANTPPSHTGAFTGCNNPSPGNIALTVTDQLSGTVLPTTAPLGSITFDINGTVPPGTIIPVELTLLSATTDAGATVGSVTLDGGSVTTEVPPGESFYSSTNPAPGEEVDFGQEVVGSATAVQQIAIQNLSSDTAFDITALGGTANVGAATIGSPSPMLPVNIPGDEGVTTQNVSFNCTPDQRGENSGTLSVTNNSDNLSPVAEYTFVCDGLTPNVAASTPATITGLTVDPTAPTGTISVTNPQDGFTSTAFQVTATAVGAANPITVITGGGPANDVAPDGNFDVVVECDNTNDGNFSRDIEITWESFDFVPRGGPAFNTTVTVDCEITDAVPSYDSTPAPAATIDLGTTPNGVTTTAVGIDVTNDGVGPAPDSNLTITGVTTSDSQFTATFNGAAIAVGDTLADAVEVTCTPDAGTGGLITATLSVTHNGDANPASPVEYDLECIGEPDGDFTSDPLPGGTLNLGIVPPNTPTPIGDIEFFNNGDTDSIEVTCNFTGDVDGAITSLDSPFSTVIGPGASATAEFQCTPPTPQSFQATFECFVEDVLQPVPRGLPDATYTIACQGQPLVVPTMNQWGLIIMSLMLLLVAGLFGRRWFASQA